jgi:glycosyltransferase involved in cell wall biosynthesis
MDEVRHMPKQPTPLVSVIIPTYNYGRFLGECIESALDQTYPNIDVIVVDDGSEDDTAAVVARYPQVRYFYQPHNGNGTVRAVNRGIREAKGELIAWLSSDDRFLSDKLEKQVRALQRAQEHDSRVCLVYSDIYCVAPDTAGLRHCPLPPEEQQRQLMEHGRVRWLGGIPRYTDDQLLAQLLSHNFINGCTTLIERHVFDDIGFFDESLPRTGDLEMWLRMLAHGYRFEFVPEPTIISQIHASNTTFWHEFPAEYNLLRRKLRTWCAADRIYPGLSPSAAHLMLGQALLQAGAPDAAAEEFHMAGLGEQDLLQQLAQAALPPRMSLEPESLPTSKRMRFVTAFEEGSHQARSYLVLSHFLQAFGPEDDVSLVVWLPSRPEALEAFSRQFEAVCAGLGLDSDAPQHAEILVMVEPPGELPYTFLNRLFAACDAFVPLAGVEDAGLYELARRANLQIVFEASIDGFRKHASRGADPFRLLLLPLGEGWSSAFEAYCREFKASEPVSLIVPTLGLNAESLQNQLLTLLAGWGVPPQTVADIQVLEVDDLEQLSGSFDMVLSKDWNVYRFHARLQVLGSPSSKQLRAMYHSFAGAV